jgi:Nucleotidyl transferase AbiEii toxin, Type IV TA system
MVKGLEIFREHFRNYADRYVLIGGAACDIAMTAAGLAFRATKDLDIVLYVEALDAAFVQAFWEFVRMGGYEVQEKSTGEKQFYRFQKPTNADYPFMLELFSRQPDVLQVAEGSHLTPLPVEEDISSLSAILLDNHYYDFIRAGRQESDGLPMVGAAQLIALKARAWLDLSERASRGEQIDSKTIKKHKNDVFRLYQILDPAIDPMAPETVKKDIREFISRMRVEEVDLKSLGLRTGTRDGILAEISKVYRLAAP